MLNTLLPIAVFLMLAYMFVRVFIMLRRDRVRAERELTRGKHAFTPKHQARFLLKRAFQPTPGEPTTQQLLSALDKVQGCGERRAR